MYLACGDAPALPPPSLGVSSLDLGRWHASGLFLLRERRVFRALTPRLRCGRATPPREALPGMEALRALRYAHSRYRHFAVEFCAPRSDIFAVR